MSDMSSWLRDMSRSEFRERPRDSWSRDTFVFRHHISDMSIWFIDISHLSPWKARPYDSLHVYRAIRVPHNICQIWVRDSLICFFNISQLLTVFTWHVRMTCQIWVRDSSILVRDKKAQRLTIFTCHARLSVQVLVTREATHYTHELEPLVVGGVVQCCYCKSDMNSWLIDISSWRETQLTTRTNSCLLLWAAQCVILCVRYEFVHPQCQFVTNVAQRLTLR